MSGGEEEDEIKRIEAALMKARERKIGRSDSNKEWRDEEAESERRKIKKKRKEYQREGNRIARELKLSEYK